MTEFSAAHLRHELRTPLNHIIGYGEMLLEDAAGGGPALAAELRALVSEARSILGVVNARLAQDGPEAAVDLPGLGVELAAPLGRILTAVERLESGAGAAGAQSWLPDLERIGQAARQLGRLVAPGPPPAAPAPAAAAVAAETPGGRGVILVVDDDATNRDILARRLAREGYETRTAPDGLAALDALRQPADRAVDVVLLDVMMPGIDGYEVLRRMKEDAALRDVPVLMISALDQVESVVRCIELGAEDYLPKPFEPVLLRARLGACLEKKRLRDQEVRHAREVAEWNRTLEARVAEQVGQLERLGRLKRFFSPALAELIVAGDAGDPLRSHRREITVVFLDLRGFTAFAETAEPEELMAVLREYHAEMGQLVLVHEGTLERFTGDGMMIFFNDPVPVPDAAERAVRMAVAMRDGVAALASRWRRQGHELSLGIGIAKGFATLGAIGFEGRWDYGAIGTVTNLAARLCGEARGGEILVSSRLAADLEPLAETEEVGPLTLKGFGRPVAALRLVALRDRT